MRSRSRCTEKDAVRTLDGFVGPKRQRASAREAAALRAATIRLPGAVAKLDKAPVSKTGDSRFESWLPRFRLVLRSSPALRVEPMHRSAAPCGLRAMTRFWSPVIQTYNRSFRGRGVVGNTGAFQAPVAGSIPVARLTFHYPAAVGPDGDVA